MSEWRELTWDDAMQRGFEALSSGEALYEEIDAEQGRSNIDIEKHLRRAEHHSFRLRFAARTSTSARGRAGGEPWRRKARAATDAGSEENHSSEAGGRVGVCPGLLRRPPSSESHGGAHSSSRLAPLIPTQTSQ
jgi:hypothetical protein